jgi:DNA-binding NarL/FixJ family response regulator
MRELQRLRPDVRVLLTSGYSESEATLRLGGDKPSGFIQKPYRPTDLMEKLDQLLRAR